MDITLGFVQIFYWNQLGTTETGRYKGDVFGTCIVVASWKKDIVGAKPGLELEVPHHYVTGTNKNQVF